MISCLAKFKSFQRKIVQMAALQKLQKSIQTLIILWLVYPIHTNSESILGDIWRATNLPFSSSRNLYSRLKLSNLVVLSFKYLSFSKQNITILFPSPLTFLQCPVEDPLPCARQSIDLFAKKNSFHFNTKIEKPTHWFYFWTSAILSVWPNDDNHYTL